MKLRRLFCCLLLFVFIFSVVFSISASAEITVDGYTVSTYYYPEVSDDFVGPVQAIEFDSEIFFKEREDFLDLRVVVELPYPIDFGNYFSLYLSIDTFGFDSYDPYVIFYDSESVALPCKYELSVSERSIGLDPVFVEQGSLSEILIDIHISKPTYYHEDLPGLNVAPDSYFYLDGNSYEFTPGMTLGDFFTLYPSPGYTVSGDYIYSSTYGSYLRFDKDGSLVHYNFPIIHNEHYYFGSESEYSGNGFGFSVETFKIGSNKFSYFEGMRWYDVVSMIPSYCFIADEDYRYSIRYKDSYDFLYYNGPVYADQLVESINYSIVSGSNIVSEIFPFISSDYIFEFSVTDVNFRLIDPETIPDGSFGSDEDSGFMSWLQNIYNSIVSLAGRIAGSIVNGLKELFVPDENFMLDYKTRFEFLLKSRFGGVYDSVDILTDFFNDLLSSSQTAMIDGEGADGYVSFPSVTFNLAGADFTFGGHEVDIIPDDFEPIIDVLKFITNVSCTLLLINSLRKRLEEILNGH